MKEIWWNTRIFVYYKGERKKHFKLSAIYFYESEVPQDFCWTSQNSHISVILLQKKLKLISKNSPWINSSKALFLPLSPSPTQTKVGDSSLYSGDLNNFNIVSKECLRIEMKSACNRKKEHNVVGGIICVKWWWHTLLL